MAQLVIETVRFRTAPGVTPDDVRDAADQVSRWLMRQPGFLSRTLCGPDEVDGSWLDIVSWHDRDCALGAAREALVSTETAPFFRLIDETSIEMSHRPLAAMG